MALYDDMWHGRPATARPLEDIDPQAPVRHHPLRGTTIALGAACALLAPVLLQTDEFLALVLAGAFLGGGHSALMWTATHPDHTVTAALLTRISTSAAVGAVVAVTGGCLYPSVGVLGAVLVLTVVLSVPYLLRRLAPRTARADAEPAGQTERRRRLPAPPLVRRSSREIAAAWSASHELLRRTTSPHERAALAGLRQAYLDELERRDPESIGRWLESGHAFDADVASYLSTEDREEPEDGAR